MASLGPFILNTVDLLWFPIVWVIATKRQRPYALLFLILCALTLRLQADMMEVMGFEKGLTGLVGGLSRARGLLIYGVFTVLYLGVLHLSRRQPWPVLLSTAIVFYVAALILSMTLMAI